MTPSAACPGSHGRLGKQCQKCTIAHDFPSRGNTRNPTALRVALKAEPPVRELRTRPARGATRERGLHGEHHPGGAVCVGELSQRHSFYVEKCRASYSRPAAMTAKRPVERSRP